MPGPAVVVRREHLEILRRAAGCASPAEAGALEPGGGSAEAARGIMMTYLKHHVAGLRDLNSERVFANIMRTP